MLAFCVNVNAQEAKTKDKKNEHREKTSSQSNIVKKAKVCKADGSCCGSGKKQCNSDKIKESKPNCTIDNKSKITSNAPKVCKADGSCCGGGKKSSKE